MSKSAAQTRWASRQQRAGDTIRRETRRIVLAAATEEFADHGYSAATVRRIAERAEVSVQSIYSAWGSKRDLLRGVMEAALTTDPEGHLDEASADCFWRDHDSGRPVGTMAPEEVLNFLARQFCQLAQDAAVGWLTYLDALGTDPLIAADWQELMDLRRVSFATHIAHISDADLRAGLTRQLAVDTAWVLVSPQTYDLMVRRAGYDLRQLERWLTDTLCAALLEPGSSPSALQLR